MAIAPMLSSCIDQLLGAIFPSVQCRRDRMANGRSVKSRAAIVIQCTFDCGIRGQASTCLDVASVIDVASPSPCRIQQEQMSRRAASARLKQDGSQTSALFFVGHGQLEICASKAALCATGRARTAADTNAVHDRLLQSMRVRFSDSEQWSSPVKPPRSQNYVKPHNARTRVHVAKKKLGLVAAPRPRCRSQRAP
jgi:hypothetical protein